MLMTFEPFVSDNCCGNFLVNFGEIFNHAVYKQNLSTKQTDAYL